MAESNSQTALPRLPDIDEVEPFGPRDQMCFDEIRAVLERHDALQRFGVTLLHQHFDVASDEVLVETIDVEKRILVSQPEVVVSGSSGVETSWRLDDPMGVRRCETLCQQDKDNEGKPWHRRQHYTTS